MKWCSRPAGWRNFAVHVGQTGRFLHPTLKSLTAEFEDLRVKKNRAYTEYHQARADMKELQIAKSNIDTLMGTGGTDHEKKRQTQKY